MTLVGFYSYFLLRLLAICAMLLPFRIGYILGRQDEAEPVLAAGKGRNNRIERP